MSPMIEDIFRKIELVPDFSGHTIASVNYRNGYGDTPLHIVSCWGECGAIEALVGAGANINAVGESGFTPLHCAVEQEKTEAVKVLLRLGAQTNLEDDEGAKPIDLAIKFKYKNIAAVLESAI